MVLTTHESKCSEHVRNLSQDASRRAVEVLPCRSHHCDPCRISRTATNVFVSLISKWKPDRSELSLTLISQGVVRVRTSLAEVAAANFKMLANLVHRRLIRCNTQQARTVTSIQGLCLNACWCFSTPNTARGTPRVP